MSAPVLDVRGLSVTFTSKRGLWSAAKSVHAVRDFDLRVDPGQTVGLVGESGSGKTTTVRAILGLVPSSGGVVRAGGFESTSFGKSVPRDYRRAVQAVFQDPYGSLNPTMVIDDIVAEPLVLHFGTTGPALRRRTAELLEAVGLAAHLGRRYPYELSGGQRQRVSIARAIAVDPRLIILDEPVSALDVSVQSQVVNLLDDLQQQTGVAYLFVAHDLAVVRHASERIVVMYRSRAVEEGPADRVCDQPQHPYTQALLAAVPVADPVRQREQRLLRQSLSRPAQGKPADGGCPFAPRCPFRMEICATVFPEWTDVPGGGRVACHFTAKNQSSTTAFAVAAEG